MAVKVIVFSPTSLSLNLIAITFFSHLSLSQVALRRHNLYLEYVLNRST